MPLNDWQDVLDARKAADQKIEAARTLLAREAQAQISDEEMAEAVMGVVDGFRLEIRCLGVTISHALDEAVNAGR